MAVSLDDRPVLPFRSHALWVRVRQQPALQLLLASALTLVALLLGWPPLAWAATLLTLVLALLQLLPPLWLVLKLRLEEPATLQTLALLAACLALLSITLLLGWWEPLLAIYASGNWEAIGALGEGVIGAFGQILVAFVALMIAWRQFQVDQRLTTQQNRITQAQTVDSFIQGITDLIADEEGMLEDWPLERMLAEGRLAAVLGSIDADGKAKVLRFLSHARLLTPLRRDSRLGRAILDGNGSYEEDRLDGLPVIRLHQVLRGADLAGTDLRGIDFNGADLRGADLQDVDLSEANLAGTNLSGANLSGARLEGTRFFWGDVDTASPAGPERIWDGSSGAGSGAVVENANLEDLRGLGAEARVYLASWSGTRSRQTLAGAGKGIPSKLER
ncbi:pentapeptide repeat-containing protein [Vulcanococcus limneticus Candia 3F8]|uniref:pentapeptide repeat-containing protein n=1 Tax=Vulcanococcus limneticus TaxID=2170428 RepID=UPI000B97DDC9|nr:pentapeptide repeat-containing protein [Vulcanococcus limneticus]MCP9790993.1 pentapeptide repeat-containing protein [Vulcanococcus limneticus MW73D5]MCP9892217.1 pentapeptide repeat-containing protein [Vulcanococcus limneticus Candia 3F8]MCP9895961.1 pentapeptide repeat-containing protein [Vulcanococcus limneticus Candia 3B3]